MSRRAETSMPAVHSEKIHQSEQGLYLGDLVYGANDGIITTFAVIAGAAGAALPVGIIIILGLANLIADGISMGLSNYLSLRSRISFQKRQRKIEEDEVRDFPDKELDEMRVIIRRWGVAEEKIEGVLADITADKKRWVDIMMRDELNIFEDAVEYPWKHGFMTFTAFLIGGFLPLVPYVFGVPADWQFLVAVASTGTALFVVGSARSLVTSAHWARAGLEMFLVGGLAAIAAYFVGGVVKVIFGVNL